MPFARESTAFSRFPMERWWILTTHWQEVGLRINSTAELVAYAIRNGLASIL
jgi:hypothetical protein